MSLGACLARRVPDVTHSAGYQPPPPPPPPPPPDPPPPDENPDDPDDAGTALESAALTPTTADDTALPKLLPDQLPPVVQPGW